MHRLGSTTTGQALRKHQLSPDSYLACCSADRLFPVHDRIHTAAPPNAHSAQESQLLDQAPYRYKPRYFGKPALHCLARQRDQNPAGTGAQTGSGYPWCATPQMSGHSAPPKNASMQEPALRHDCPALKNWKDSKTPWTEPHQHTLRSHHRTPPLLLDSRTIRCGS